MARYKIITFIDITRTNPNRSETDTLKIGQQSNFNSLLQAIGLRSNVEWDVDPKMMTGALPDNLEGKANHWVWDFKTEREDVFKENNDPVFLLINDLNCVPIVADLMNSVELNPAAFITKGTNANTWVTLM